ncbi:MAG TPA: b(o/a)3-type cytochrome-c oxidase subunit 1 [Longimicrobiales bacterium]|nr:b(o/a)3-type cytochrome-c oxidase subunit 1 [Longimicrobiales bacterium]
MTDIAAQGSLAPGDAELRRSGVSDAALASPPAVGSSWSKLALAHFGVAVVAFGVAATIAVMQAMSRANAALPFRSERIFYLSVTAHGVLMAIVFTTFFIMGLGYVIARVGLRREIAGERLAWAGYFVALVGTILAAAVILAGKASVLYTFYPPLKAHPLFYIGATLLVAGSWLWCVVMVRSYRAWRRENPGQPVPLPMHGIMATVIVWVLATIGVALEMVFLLIPWSLGLRDTVDPVLARTLFWWFGHPLVYFWLLPAYTLWYTVLPREAGGKLFSDPLARLVFVLFILFSTPVGFHHQFMDPGIPAGWKLAHTLSTFVILFPSFVTAFTIIASLEYAGRARGGTGLFGWIGRLPWKEPFFSSVALAMLVFALGGMGGAINAAYGMNAVVHNTAWVQGHFHLTVGTAVALTFMGATYWILPRLTGRPLRLPAFAAVQPYLWFVGMMTFSVVNHATGLLGMPRRVYDASYGGHPAAQAWQAWTGLSAIGGVILFASAMCFVAVVVATILNKRREDAPAITFAEPIGGTAHGGSILDRFGFWTVVAAVLVVLAYAYPIFDLLRMERFGAPGWSPF